MKNTKKFISAALAALMIFIASFPAAAGSKGYACGNTACVKVCADEAEKQDAQEPVVCDHVDEDMDGSCDNCGEAVRKSDSLTAALLKLLNFFERLFRKIYAAALAFIVDNIGKQ